MIADKETALGFSLVGVESVIADSEKEILNTFRKVKDRSDIGIFLITERLAQKARPFLNKILHEKGGPLILEIPDRHGFLSEKGPVESLVVSALGIKV